MKKTLLLALALIAVGCAEPEPNPRNLDELSRQGPQYLDPETLEPYSGPAFRMSEYDSTELVLRVNLRDGRLHGDFEDFDPEGAAEEDSLYQTGTYRDGQREGRFEFFYPSGVLRGRGTYENGLEEGPYESWFENGELRSRANYVAGEEDGPSELYYENGQLSTKVIHKDGELDGPLELYYENGQLMERGTVNMGRKCGMWVEDGETESYDPCPPDLEGGN